MGRIDWRETARFCAAAFCMDFASGMYMVALPYLAMRMGADSLDLGYISSVRSVVYLAACLTVARLADRMPRGRLFVVGVGVVAAGHALTAYASAVAVLYVTAVTWALGLSLFWPSLFAWLGDAHGPKTLGRAMGAVNLSWSVGGMVGGAAAGGLFRQWAALPFLGACVAAAAAWLGGSRAAVCWVCCWASSPSSANRSGWTPRCSACSGP